MYSAIDSRGQSSGFTLQAAYTAAKLQATGKTDTDHAIIRFAEEKKVKISADVQVGCVCLCCF